MTIQLNTDNNLKMHEAFGTKLDDLLKDELSRFSDYITRLEVHLSDQNGSKNGINDKQCVLEARLEGRQPVAVTALGNNYELAVKSAIDKLKASLDTVIGRIRNHRGVE